MSKVEERKARMKCLIIVFLLSFDFSKREAREREGMAIGVKEKDDDDVRSDGTENSLTGVGYSDINLSEEEEKRRMRIERVEKRPGLGVIRDMVSPSLGSLPENSKEAKRQLDEAMQPLLTGLREGVSYRLISQFWWTKLQEYFTIGYPPPPSIDNRNLFELYESFPDRVGRQNFNMRENVGMKGEKDASFSLSQFSFTDSLSLSNIVHCSLLLSIILTLSIFIHRLSLSFQYR